MLADNPRWIDGADADVPRKTSSNRVTSYDVARADGFPADRLPGLYLRSSVNSTTLLAQGATRIVRQQSNPSNPSAKGTSGNFGASEQWAGRVCSVACQVHTNIRVAVETGPILDAFRLRRGPWERATRPAHGLCGDWPSLLQWTCSPAHWSCQGAILVAKNSGCIHPP